MSAFSGRERGVTRKPIATRPAGDARSDAKLTGLGRTKAGLGRLARLVGGRGYGKRLISVPEGSDSRRGVTAGLMTLPTQVIYLRHIRDALLAVSEYTKEVASRFFGPR